MTETQEEIEESLLNTDDGLTFNEAKIFLEEIRKVIVEAKKLGKEVMYASEEFLILKFEDAKDTIFEVINRDDSILSSKLVYIGEPQLKSSYLLNLINKQELKNGVYKERDL